MALVQVSEKGQIVIPQPLRAKYGIDPGSRAEIIDEGGRLVVIPIPKDPVRGARGMVSLPGSTASILSRFRAEDARKTEAIVHPHE